MKLGIFLSVVGLAVLMATHLGAQASGAAGGAASGAGGGGASPGTPKIPITGTFQKTDVHVWPTVTTLLQNAFVRALAPKPDQKVTVEKVQQSNE